MYRIIFLLYYFVKLYGELLFCNTCPKNIALNVLLKERGTPKSPSFMVLLMFNSNILNLVH